MSPESALTDRLSIGVAGQHTRFPIDGTSALDAGSMTTWSASARFFVQLLPVSFPIQFYTTAGGGVYRLNHVPSRIVCVVGPCPPYFINDDPEVRLGLQAGLGVTVPLAPVLRAFVESTYTGLFSGKGNFQYVPVLLGLHYHLVR